MRISPLDVYKKAYCNYGIPAFNVFNAEQIHGIISGAELSKLPIIVQITPVSRNYMNPIFLENMINAAEIIYPKSQYFVHLDHGNVEHCNDAINSEFYNSVMIDASHEDFVKNIEITSEIVNKAHEKGIVVEAELGILSGIEDDLISEKSLFTDPDQAVEFVEKTQCDSLAIAIGTSHGVYKLKNTEGLKIDILKRIKELLPNFPIVLHGASNVSQNEIQRINNVGGKINNAAKGIDQQELLEAVKLGVTKINIATDLRILWTRIHRNFFNNSPEQFDPVTPGKEYIKELCQFVKNKCESFLVNPNWKLSKL